MQDVEGVFSRQGKRGVGENFSWQQLSVIDGLQGHGLVQCFPQLAQEMEFQWDLSDGLWCSPKEHFCLQ